MLPVSPGINSWRTRSSPNFAWRTANLLSSSVRLWTIHTPFDPPSRAGFTTAGNSASSGDRYTRIVCRPARSRACISFAL